MTSFSALYLELATTSSTTEKIRMLAEYFSAAAASDLGWSVSILSGEKRRKAISGAALRGLVGELSSLPLWLIEESYHVVGDLAETCALLAPAAESDSGMSLSDWVAICERVTLASLPEKKQILSETWRQLTPHEIHVFNKLLTGGLRIGVSRGLVIKALSSVVGCEPAVMAHRLMVQRNPAEVNLTTLSQELARDRSIVPYPFCLAHQFDDAITANSPIEGWIAEWKWDGIRAQVVRRESLFAIWTRGEELVTDAFPELTVLSERLPEDVVLDGELVVRRGQEVAPFGDLQKRVNRTSVSAAFAARYPVHFIAYDLLEIDCRDIRAEPLYQRRELLRQVIQGCQAVEGQISLSQEIESKDWDELILQRAAARAQNAEGLMLKNRFSSYSVGRKRGDWWKWKVDPLSIDAVLLYAQKGHGRRANLFTDYTFAVWREGALVPFAKAYSGLTNKEIAEVDRFVRNHAQDSFGPVRSVPPALVFEIGFEGIQRSKRHKSGVAVRFPRILRWRRDKRPEEADTVELLEQLVEAQSSTQGSELLPD
jgi:DNA ligase-1